MGYRAFDTSQDRHRGELQDELAPMVEAARGVVRAVLAKPIGDEEASEGLWRILKGATRMEYHVFVAVLVDEVVARRRCN